ncbi:hypothetical protein [Streptomyces sp. NPDC006784]|uniref:hypothetical protein n=1 Tax=Streptomyces sp. NPDC006784 TaxID=3364764 RepID=UPI0036A786BE
MRGVLAFVFLELSRVLQLAGPGAVGTALRALGGGCRTFSSADGAPIADEGTGAADEGQKVLVLALVSRPGPFRRRSRQLIESVDDTCTGQFGLGQHGGRTCEGVAARGARRVLAMAAAIRRS